MKTCDVCGCNENETHNMTNSSKYGMMLCGKHYQQLKRHGKIIDPLKQVRNRNAQNEIVLHEDCAEIILYDMIGNPINKAVIDLDDAKRCKGYKWFVDTKDYVSANCNKTKIRLHRFIMNVLDNEDILIDHVDRNPLNNRKSNLRHCVYQENAQNRSILYRNVSGTTGIYWHKGKKKWEARIGVNDKCLYLGQYDNKEEAIRVRKEAEIKYFGEFAPNNK